MLCLCETSYIISEMSLRNSVLAENGLFLQKTAKVLQIVPVAKPQGTNGDLYAKNTHGNIGKFIMRI